MNRPKFPGMKNNLMDQTINKKISITKFVKYGLWVDAKQTCQQTCILSRTI